MSKEKSILGGAVIAAFFGSLCCTLPLLFILLGVGAGVTGSYFEALRPYLLAASVFLLALAFYWIYIRQRNTECAPGEACATQPRGRVGLWVASFLVLAFALMPYVTASLAAKLIERKTAQADCCVAKLPEKEASLNGASREQETVTFDVEGMTCESCEMGIKSALNRTSGVEGAKVSYAEKKAVVQYDPKKTSPEKLRDAINNTGYSAEEKK